ncbi:conserved hypothetical protein [Rhodospirillaceae bacterium LM-1]|nr:conserved hypothetical protein [Rhodospirillaceae bacterium LM-1]
MIYPQQGFSGAYVRHIPLSLLYATAEAVKRGYDVRILDARVVSDFKAELQALLNDDTLCVGISVMSGSPIANAVEIGRQVKELAPLVPIVWGGPHATFHPRSILEGDRNCDFVVSGYASNSFAQLCDALCVGGSLEEIDGLSWRHGITLHINVRPQDKFEFIDYRDIPYHLIEDYSLYGQLEQNRRIFSMYSAMGCPYQCSFCSSPAQYAPIRGKKWVALTAGDVVDHIQYVQDRYGANYIYFIDDDSFPNLKHVEGIIDELKRRGLNIGLGFRGARINEIKTMSDAFLDKLAEAGTDIMHIGAECGSDKVLKILRKNSTAQDIIDCNRKLARHPQITAAYNFIMGIPGETLDDLKKTRDLMLQLVADHPNCIIFPPNKFRPLPGTELYDIAQKEWGYSMPQTLDDWAEIEVESDISEKWYSPQMQKFCNLLLISSYFIDNKAAKLTTGKTLFFKFARLANWIYRPIALFRLKRGFSCLLVEYSIYRLATKMIQRLRN